ncbi:flagellar biosynthesis anti-sigma factor FlgM [uncultured Amphritea sp.]|uniref:flagellar biosynthesis anti-sigma factor FlgM n=1 Tax=uncultured Amphritea sp. TaxID=981605 RepID=UPI0025EF1DC1|nr:flagellar biosynthesis anti-sigma factor FlgM [uncultured Amphritea sp.]
MVIDITGLTSSSQAANSRAKVSEQPATESKAQQQSVDTGPAASSGLSLSDAAQAVQKSAGQAVEEGISVNEQKIAELKAAIDDGSYQINYESTARGLFQLESMLD